MEIRTDAKKYSFTNRVIDNKAFMLLNMGIGPDINNPQEKYIDGASFQDEMYAHKGIGRDVTVKINTPGGNVYHGWNMVDGIIETKANTIAVGLAYSMGGVCLMAGKFRQAYAHASIMIHAPRAPKGAGNPPMLEVVKNQFRALLESRTRFTKDEVNEMMDSGKDYFFTPAQAKEKGIIDEILDSNLTLPVNASQTELYLFYNNHIDENQKQNKHMGIEFFNKFFNGKDESESAVNAVQMKSENETLKAEKAAKESEITMLKAKVAEFEAAGKVIEAKNKGAQLIEDAVKAGKIAPSAEDKEKLIENATANYDAVKLMIDAMATKKTTAVASFAKEDGKGDTDKKTYEYLANHNPKELARIAEEDPELFNKLSDDYIAKSKEAR